MAKHCSFICCHPVMCTTVIMLAAVGGCGMCMAIKKKKSSMASTIKTCTADCMEKCEEICKNAADTACKKIEEICAQMNSKSKAKQKSEQSSDCECS